jgi:putative redox protein
MQALLLAAAGCTGADVVTILERMRAGLEKLSIDVVGTRRDEHPKRYVAVRLEFTMSGSSLDAAKAERAVGLSIEKYCSVLHTFDQRIEVEYEIDLV